MHIAYLGLGIMGSRMAANLLAAGHQLTVWNRHADKAGELVAAGAELARTSAEAVEGAEVICTMLSRPSSVEAVAFGEAGFAERLRSDQVWMDSSTVDPEFARELGRRARAQGYRFIDAPVAGSKQPAADGTLTFLVGGDEADVAKCQPLFDAMGSATVHLGPVGRGATMKVMINGLLAQGMLAFAEAVHLGVAEGLDRGQVFDVLLGAPVTAPFLQGIRARTEGGDHAVNFPLKHMHKDLHLAANTAFARDVAMPSLNAAKEAYALALAHGFGDEDFSAIYRFVGGEGG